MTTSYTKIRAENLGEKHSWINNGIRSADTIVTLRAWNWIPNENKGTFLYSETYLGWFGADNNVTMDSAPMNQKYQFVIQKCNGGGLVYYGDMVVLRSVGSGKYMQCGGGTCSGVDTPGCTDSSWQTFTIVSAEGKTGQVNFGDPVYIRQVVGNKCAITPAGDRTMWCTDGNHNNAYLIILPNNGSVYVDPTSESSYYTENLRKNDFKTLDPTASDGEDTKKALESWDIGAFFSHPAVIIILVLVLASIVLGIVVQISKLLGGSGGRRRGNYGPRKNSSYSALDEGDE